MKLPFLVKNFIGLNALLLSPAGVLAQGIINNGAAITINDGAYIYIDGGTNGDFTNQDAAGPSYGIIEIISDGTIQLEGDWVNNSADPANKVFSIVLDGTAEFLGTTSQAIGGSASTNFPTLLINNSSGLAAGVTLNIPAHIHNTLTLTDGVLNTTTANYIRLENGASTTTGSATSYIDGPMRYAMAVNGARTLNLPLGKDNDWRPAIINPTHSAFTEYFYTAELFNGNANSLGLTMDPAYTHASRVHYYNITRSSVANFTSSTIQLFYSTSDGTDDEVTDRLTLGIVKDNGSGAWTDIASGAGTANGTGNITSAAFTPYDTYFALANKVGGTNPLPVELLSFTGECNENKMAQLQWTTLAEINNAFFTLNKSYNGINYTTIANIPGTGNSSSLTQYSYTDTSASGQNAYYSLTQTDFDGKTKTFSPLTVNCTDSNPVSLTVFPNPSHGNFNILLSGMKNKKLQASLYDVLGREIYTNEFIVVNNNQLYEISNITTLTTGTYMLIVKSSHEIYSQKIVIN